MDKYPHAYGGISIRIHDMEGLLEKYGEEPGADIKKQVLNLLQDELNVRFEMESPEDVFYFSTESDFILDVVSLSEIADYVEGAGEFTFPDEAAYEPENTSRRVYIHEGRIYEDIPDIIWHPPTGMDLSLLGHDEERDDPVNARIETLSEAYQDGAYDVLFTTKQDGHTIRRGSTGALQESIALAKDRAVSSPEDTVLIKDKTNNLFNASQLTGREKKAHIRKGR